jgi:hypothetical protein
LTNPKGDMSCFSQSVSMTKRNNIVLLKNNSMGDSRSLFVRNFLISQNRFNIKIGSRGFSRYKN